MSSSRSKRGCKRTLPIEVAKLVRYVLSEDARGINGQALTIDGGEIEH